MLVRWPHELCLGYGAIVQPQLGRFLFLSRPELSFEGFYYWDIFVTPASSMCIDCVFNYIDPVWMCRPRMLARKLVCVRVELTPWPLESHIMDLIGDERAVRFWVSCLIIVRRDLDVRLDRHVIPGDNLVQNIERPVMCYEINVMPREVFS